MASTDASNAESWRLGTADLIQNIALLSWMNKGEDSEKFYKLITAGRVWYELYKRVSSDDEIDQAKAECILGIAEYIKKNPKASKEDVTKEVAKHIQAFAAKIDGM